MKPVALTHFLVQPQIPAIAKLFIKVPDAHIWRWENPLAEPGDPPVRVDFYSGGDGSGPAEAVNNKFPDK